MVFAENEWRDKRSSGHDDVFIYHAEECPERKDNVWESLWEFAHTTSWPHQQVCLHDTQHLNNTTTWDSHNILSVALKWYGIVYLPLLCRLKKLEQTMEEMDLPEIEVGRRGIVMLLRSFYREMREEYNMLRRKRNFWDWGDHG